MRKKEVIINAFKAAFPHTIPILAGFSFLGFSFGVLMNVSGFSFWYPLVMSIIVFGGSIEFVAVSMLLSPFAVFQSKKRQTPKFIEYLGKALPAAVFAMLVVYCLKNVDILTGSHGLPELIAIIVVVLLHLWRKQMLLSIAGGTVCYMLLVQFVFK